MSNEATLKTFVADWFRRFDRLDPVDVFLADLDPNIDWDMPDVDMTLTGHDRFRAWYAGVLETFERPSEHHVSNIKVTDSTATFDVLFRAHLKNGGSVEIHVRERWRYLMRPDGRPLITHYRADLFEKETTQ